MPDISNKEVALLELVQPKFLSLVKKPANRTSFKVVRSEEEGIGEVARRIRSRIAKRSDAYLLSISLPLGATREEAESVVKAFDLGEEFALDGDEDAGFKLTKKHAASDVSSMEINIGNGFTAEVDSSAFAKRSDEVEGQFESSGVSVTAIRFENENWDKDSIDQWLDTNKITFSTIEGTTVHRYQVPKHVDTYDVKIEDGVYATIARSENTDIPSTIYRSVIEQSYGVYGYGHLDFLQGIYDKEYSYKVDDAIYLLRDVLDNILIYSYLSLDARKTLVQNALQSFNLYVSSLIDALPVEVIRQARADLKIIQEADKMPNTKDTTKDDKSVTRSDAQPQTDDTAAQTTADSQTQETKVEYVTREDLKTEVASAVAEAIRAVKEEENAKRGDNTDDTLKEALNTITDSIKTIKESVESVTRSVGDLKNEVDELGGSTVTRSTDEGTSTATVTEEHTQQRSDASPFAGMFGDRFMGINPHR